MKHSKTAVHLFHSTEADALASWQKKFVDELRTFVLNSTVDKMIDGMMTR